MSETEGSAGPCHSSCLGEPVSQVSAQVSGCSVACSIVTAGLRGALPVCAWPSAEDTCHVGAH